MRASAERQALSPEAAMLQPCPLVIAHRGYCRLGPENTLPAFRLALSAQADLVELDFRWSRDRVPMVIHDADLNRTTDARRRWGRKRARVEHHTAVEIQTLDAGQWFEAKFAGARVPLLSEAVEVIQQGSLPLLERKAGDASETATWLRRKDLIHRVIVQAFDWEFLRALHHVEPELILGALGPPNRLALGRKPLILSRRLGVRWLNQAQHTGARVVVWNRRVSPRAVKAAHQHGLKVWVYTIDDPRLAQRLLKAGVDGIITNNPTPIRDMVSRWAHA